MWRVFRALINSSLLLGCTWHFLVVGIVVLGYFRYKIYNSFWIICLIFHTKIVLFTSQLRALLIILHLFKLVEIIKACCLIWRWVVNWVYGVRNLGDFVLRNTLFCCVLRISCCCKSIALKIILRHWNLRSRNWRWEKLHLFLRFISWTANRFPKLRVVSLFLEILHKNWLLMQLRVARL